MRTVERACPCFDSCSSSRAVLALRGGLLLHGDNDVFNARDEVTSELDVGKIVDAWDEDQDGDISRMEVCYRG